MLKLHNKLAASAPFVRECDLSDVLRVMDRDADGKIEGNTIRDLFQHVLGFDPFKGRPIGAQDEMDLQQFKGLLEELHRRYPAWNVVGKTIALAQRYQSTFTTMSGAKDAEAKVSKKALLVGINYLGTPNALGGCINDQRNEMKVLIEHFGFHPENIVLLTEDQEVAKRPTCDNIRKGMSWLLDGAKPGDFLFFGYSGHGSQMAAKSGTGQGHEEDGLNECICPVDCMDEPWPRRIILDNELNDVFYDSLPEGVHCLCVYDCCHSATMEDLAYTLRPPSVAGVKSASDQKATRALGVRSRFMEPPQAQQAQVASMQQLQRGPSARQRSIGSSSALGGTRAINSSKPKLLFVVSGCQDSQTSADATIGSSRQGAMTWALLDTLRNSDYRISYQDLLTGMRATLAGKYEQIPALSSTSEANFHKLYLGGPSASSTGGGSSVPAAAPSMLFSPPSRGIPSSSSTCSPAAVDSRGGSLSDKLRWCSVQLGSLESRLGDHADDRSELEVRIDELREHLADLSRRITLEEVSRVQEAVNLPVPDLDFDPDLDEPDPAPAGEGSRAVSAPQSAVSPAVAASPAPKPSTDTAASKPSAPSGPTVGAANGYHPLQRPAQPAEEAKARKAVCGHWISEKGECRIFEDPITNRLSYEEILEDDEVRLHGFLTRQDEELSWKATLHMLAPDESAWYGPSCGEEPDVAGEILLRLTSGPAPSLETCIRDELDTEWSEPTVFSKME